MEILQRRLNFNNNSFKDITRKQEFNSPRVNDLLSKIQNSQMNIKDLISHLPRRSHLLGSQTEPIKSQHSNHQLHEAQSQDQMVLPTAGKEPEPVIEDFATAKEEKKIEQPVVTPAHKQKPLTMKIKQAIQQINDRDLKTIKKIANYESQSPKTSMRKQQPHREEEAPIIRNRNDLNGRDKISKQESKQKQKNKDNGDNKQLRRSYLDIDLKNFKKGVNGTLIRMDPINFQEEVQKKFLDSKTKKGQKLIVSMINRSQEDFLPKVEQKKPLPLYEIDPLLVKKYCQSTYMLDVTAPANSIYEYFNGLCTAVDCKFKELLIKKYKNCLYYGQNPIVSNSNRTVYQGILYHFGSKIYYGQFLDGKKTGRGVEISFKENMISIGRFQSGNKVGVFKVVKFDDYQYEGEVFDNLFNGKGVLITKYSKYEGSFRDGYKTGYGQQSFFLNGEFYQGNYQIGNFEGRGQISGKNYYYQGFFHENMKDGEGYQKTPMEQYRGTFIRGKRDGKGVLSFSNGDVYSGEFKDGQVYGRGQYQYANKNTVSGYFVNGRLMSQDRKATNSQRKNYDPIDRQYVQQNQSQFMTDRSFNRQSKPIFNPSKLINLSNFEMHQNERPRFNSSPRKFQENFMNRRNSELEKVKYTEEPLPIFQAPRHQSTERRNMLNESMKNYGRRNQSNPKNNFMQLDYSLNDHSVEEQPILPVINTRRMRHI